MKTWVTRNKVSGKLWRRIVLYLGFVLLAGCVSKPNPRKEYFSFEPISQKVKQGEHRYDVILVIKDFRAAPQFTAPSFVYRTGEYSYETDFYHEFLVRPQSMFGTDLALMMSGAGLVKGIALSGSRAQIDYYLECTITELYGDFRNKDKPDAVLTIYYALLPGNTAKTRQILHKKKYSKRIPIEDRTAVAVFKGWDQANKEIFSELAQDLSKAFEGANLDLVE